MLEIRNTNVFGLERSLLAAGNPMTIGEINTRFDFKISSSDDFKSLEREKARARRLGSVSLGSGHDNFLSGIDVYYDIKYSLYWSPEFQRYHFNQIISSQSKMHKLTSMGKNWDQFRALFNKYTELDSIRIVFKLIQEYNSTSDDFPELKYSLFMRALSSLPAGIEMWMTIKTNYLQLKTMYNQRKHHKLKEDWGAFCNWCLELPMFQELTGVKEND